MNFIRASKWPAFITSCVLCRRRLQSDSEGGAWADPGCPGEFLCLQCKSATEVIRNGRETVESGDGKVKS